MHQRVCVGSSTAAVHEQYTIARSENPCVDVPFSVEGNSKLYATVVSAMPCGSSVHASY